MFCRFHLRVIGRPGRVGIRRPARYEELLVKTLIEKTCSFLRSEDGPTVTEYAVMLALIIVGCFATIILIANKVRIIFTNLEDGLPTVS